jgi:tetratricopeptide (TPR) repeat protein
MKIFRHFHHALIFSAIGALALLNSGCEYANKVIAKDQLNQGAILYNQGNFKKAQEFFKSATETDPSNSVAWLYLGATMVKEYKGGDELNRDLANQTLDVYKKALDLSEGNCSNYDNAISYIASIYDDLGNGEEWRNWMLKRAEGKCVLNNEVKATTYYAVAVKYWTCSYDETTRYQDKAKLSADPFHYRNMDYPEALADKKKAEDCAVKGLEYIEKAIQVDPTYVDALFYKGLLYREQQKLTKDEARRKELAATSVRIADEASALMKKKEAEAAAAQPEG